MWWRTLTNSPPPQVVAPRRLCPDTADVARLRRGRGRAQHQRLCMRQPAAAAPPGLQVRTPQATARLHRAVILRDGAAAQARAPTGPLPPCFPPRAAPPDPMVAALCGVLSTAAAAKGAAAALAPGWLAQLVLPPGAATPEVAALMGVVGATSWLAAAWLSALKVAAGPRAAQSPARSRRFQPFTTLLMRFGGLAPHTHTSLRRIPLPTANLTASLTPCATPLTASPPPPAPARPSPSHRPTAAGCSGARAPGI